MAKYNKLYDPKKRGFKNKTRGGYRAYIFRTDSTNKKGSLNGVVLGGAQVTVRTWKDNGGYYDSGLISPYDLIPIKDEKVHFEDLTKINVPFGELDKDTQKRLKEWPHGVEERLNYNKWFVLEPCFGDGCTYRAIPEPVEKPKPEYEVGRWYPWNGGECPVPYDTKVAIFLSSDDEIRSEVTFANSYFWSEAGGIVAFKVVSYA